MRDNTIHHAGRPHESRRGAYILCGLVLAVLAIGLWVRAGEAMPMSAVDEHMHLDTHQRVHDGGYPHRGSLMTMAVVREWACGVGHEAGAAMAPCDHPDLGPNSLPSGIHTTGYIHYPTYFVVGEGYRAVEEAVADPDSWVDTYRRYAALVAIAGLLACFAGAWALGMRGAALVAGTLGPSAAAGVLLYGTIANPQSAAVLAGALIAGTGIRWMLTGRGFWWLAAATALASGIAVTHTLPAGAFMLATTAALVLRRFGWHVTGRWDPRWWQVGVLGVIVVTPVIVFSWWISSHATIPNDELYSFATLDSWRTVVAGAAEELATIHSPWYAAGSLGAGADGNLAQNVLRASVHGLPAWQTIVVYAVLATATVRFTRPVLAGRRAAATDAQAGAERTLSPTMLLAASTLVGIMVYPVLLRVSNALNVGFDYPIVARYSIGFAPLLVWLVVLLCHDRPLLTKGLAALAAVTPLAVGLAIW
ncbi:hypothetical protein [Nocardioides sp. zg-1228]|uniref:hypothetical protein n=1 Tax=Nocardioides sp. zg-1228 TaxID=2763008 RepID=UPI00164356A0|nr:hypothetical protein [Nocardioides sp. zg-1228]MBC2933233.1 hypothetical protein [Nocardioides sp. zg-1228]QSF56598.1 hypothetical protein JX575_13295 [Nocardioides sp. zg-1228]